MVGATMCYLRNVVVVVDEIVVAPVAVQLVQLQLVQLVQLGVIRLNIIENIKVFIKKSKTLSSINY